MMHVLYNIVFTTTDVVAKIITFLKTNYLKYQVMQSLLYQVISKAFQVSN